MEMLNKIKWNSLVVQWVGPYMSTAGDTGLILWSSTKIPHALQCSQKKKRRGEDFLMSLTQQLLLKSSSCLGNVII